MNDQNGCIRQIDFRIELLDRRVIPLGDLAEINVRDGRAVENKLTG